MASSFRARISAALDARRASRFNGGDVAAGAITFVWFLIAFVKRDPIYDVSAVVASTVVVGCALAFFRWEPPPGQEPMRLLGFFVFGQTFFASGLGVLTEVTPNPLFAVPTTEAFSFSVISSTVFAGAFVGGAWLTAPRKAPPELPGEAGPTPAVALGLAVAATLVNVQFVLTTSVTNVSRLGILPLILLNLTMLASMLVTSALTTRNAMRLPLAILVAGQALATFYTSMLMVVTFILRDIILTYVYLRKRLPYGMIAAMFLIILFLNPVKMTFRNNRVDLRGDSELTSSTAFDFWAEGIESTWGGGNRGSRGTDAAIETTSNRINYNWFSAHVYSTVPSRYPFMEGRTYEDIPMMLVPRILYPDKPLSATSTRSRWLIMLGIQSERSAETTAVSLPTPAESYWNFGWAGVVGVPALLGMLVGGLLRFVPRDRVARAGYVMVVVIYMGVFVDMMVWILPNIVIVAITGVLASLYSRIGRVRQTTPLKRVAVADR